MLTDEQLNYFDSVNITDDDYAQKQIDKLIDEIKRLRSERDEFIRELSVLRGIVIDLSHELARYKTPNVDNVDSERCCLERVKKARKR